MAYETKHYFTNVSRVKFDMIRIYIYIHIYNALIHAYIYA
jgi:hypothetical protein